MLNNQCFSFKKKIIIKHILCFCAFPSCVLQMPICHNHPGYNKIIYPNIAGLKWIIFPQLNFQTRGTSPIVFSLQIIPRLNLKFKQKKIVAFLVQVSPYCAKTRQCEAALRTASAYAYCSLNTYFSRNNNIKESPSLLKLIILWNQKPLCAFLYADFGWMLPP